MSVSPLPPPLTREGLAEPALGSRELFPDLKAGAYLAHAAISPASTALTRAVADAVDLVAEGGVASFPVLSAQRERLRESLATLWNVPSRQVTLTPGCTRGMGDLASSLPWKAGDVLVTYRGEFPANVTPWQLAASRFHGAVELRSLPDPLDPECGPKLLDDLVQALRERTNGSSVRWVAISAVQFQTGLRMPLAEMAAICRENGAHLLVDGIQAAGSTPLDLARLRVDAFFVGAHKWLLGLEGVGAAYLSEDLMAELSPLSAGWLSHVDGDHFLFRGEGHLDYNRPLLDTPRVFEGSTMNALGFVALEAGVDVVSAVGVTEIFTHIQRYHDAVEPAFVTRGFESLRAADPGMRSCLLSFRVPAGLDVPSFASEVRKRGVVVSTPDGLLRLAPHFSNDLGEVALVRDALSEILG